MSEPDLMYMLVSDMSRIGFPTDSTDIQFRPYSKSYYGRYYPSRNGKNARIVIYPYEPDGRFMDYKSIVLTGIHEFTHHVQYTSGGFVRRKGVMHNTQFWQLYNHYVLEAYSLGILKGAI